MNLITISIAATSPIVLFARVAKFFKRRGSGDPADRFDSAWPHPQKRSRPAQLIVIEGEYEVIDNEDKSPGPRATT